MRGSSVCAEHRTNSCWGSIITTSGEVAGRRQPRMKEGAGTRPLPADEGRVRCGFRGSAPRVRC